MRSERVGRVNIGWALLLPALVILVAIVVFPFLYSVALNFSYHDIWSGAWSWAGLRNIVSVLGDSRFYNSLRVVFSVALMALPAEFILGFILALVLARGVLGKRIVLSLLLLPVTIAPIASGEIWRLIFNADYGPANYLLEKVFHLAPIVWLNDPKMSIVAITIAEVWQWTPFVMLLLYGGLMSIPPELTDAAHVDGATYMQRLRYLTIPFLRPIIMVALIMRAVELLKMFELPFIMTQGGPGECTETVAMYIYKTGFYFWNMPAAAVMSFALLAIIVFTVTVYMRRFVKYEL